MYRVLIRPILFLFPPETVHHIVIGLLKFLLRIPGFSPLTRYFCHSNTKKLQTNFLGIPFSSPLGLAAGFDKNGEVYNELSDLGFSHIEVGTVTPKGQSGNPQPRSFRLTEDRGLINRMGFNNRGVDQLKVELSKKRRKKLVIGGNIGKNTLTPNKDAVEDYAACFSALYGHVDYFVVNVSCPNITDLHELQDQDGLEAILSRLSGMRKKEDQYIPILLKISPDLNTKQIDTTLDIVKKYGIDGIVATNTSLSRKDLKTDENRLKIIGKGGLSGAPISSKSLEVVRYISKKTEGTLPIIGVGGIMTVQDALNMLDAGATLIQIYTGFIYKGPGIVKKINKAILQRICEADK